MPDRADLEVAFVDAERGFRFGQLNVMLPQRLGVTGNPPATNPAFCGISGSDQEQTSV